MSIADAGAPPPGPGVTSAAAGRGPLAIEAISVSKDFRLGRGQVLHAVREVSFGLYRGAVVALVGESGSGKSTVARTLVRINRPTDGSVLLSGAETARLGGQELRAYRRRMQMVYQDPYDSLDPR